jgi:hypothetical protein
MHIQPADVGTSGLWTKSWTIEAIASAAIQIITKQP